MDYRDEMFPLIGMIGSSDRDFKKTAVVDAINQMRSLAMEIVGIPDLDPERIYVAAVMIEDVAIDLYRSPPVMVMQPDEREIIRAITDEARRAVNEVLAGIGCTTG